MRRLLIATTVVAALVVAASGFAAARPVRVLYIGDSLTGGALASSGQHTFHHLVTAALEQRGEQVVEKVVAKSGVKTSYWKAAAIPAGQDIAVVELGTNDAPWTPLDQFAADYTKLLATIKAKSPHARFICVSVWRAKAPAGASTALAQEDAQGVANAPALDAVIRRLCPGRYVNVQRFAHTPNVGSDGFHPNDAGHRLIATAILNALR